MAGDATLRWLRASVLSLVMVLGGLAGHVAAGGVAASSATVLMMLAATGVLVAPMLGAPASTSRVVVLVAAGQGAVHLALQLLAPPARMAHNGGSMPMTGAMSATGHGSAHHDAVLALMNGADLAMLVGHLAAAVAVGVWLAAGERAAWALLAMTGGSVVESLRVLLHTAALRPAFAGPTRQPAGAVPGWLLAVPLRASMWDGYAVSRRGPPCC